MTTLDDAGRFVQKAIQQSYPHGIPDPLAICIKENPEIVVGTIGCFRPVSALPTVELAFDLDPKHWGKGFAVEAGNAMIDLAFDSLPFERLQARCTVENIASRRVLEKLGMNFEGTLRGAMFYGGRLWDMEYFSVLRSDRHQRQVNTIQDPPDLNEFRPSEADRCGARSTLL